MQPQLALTALNFKAIYMSQQHTAGGEINSLKSHISLHTFNWRRGLL